MQTRMAKAALWISAVLYVMCLTQDGYYIDGPDPEAWAPAYGLLISGWLGLFAGVFAWLANFSLQHGRSTRVKRQRA